MYSSQVGMRVALARADGGTRVTSRVLLLYAGRWPHLTARTPVTSLHYPDRPLFTNTKERILFGKKGA